MSVWLAGDVYICIFANSTWKSSPDYRKNAA